jgi:hypothetical protein
MLKLLSAGRIGANINNDNIEAKSPVVNIQKLCFSVSFGSKKYNQTSKPIAIIFLMIDSTGVIGINSPKQPQLPVFPLVATKYTKCTMNTESIKTVTGMMNRFRKLRCNNKSPKANSIPIKIREKYGATACENPSGSNCFNSNVEMAK